ncbi:MAG: dTDP-glucose 4,6-dehydratase [Pseudomonadales bacterium]|jgi:dTDP-glucose 4,6-dehydratase|nr:dTDP-glucose 4,6-dehydratase [Pseudomonadales bacterium]
MTKILVTGGAGFIGSNFILYWLKNHPNDQIINVDALTYAGNLENLKSVADNPNYKFVKGDITNKEQMVKLTEGVDLIVHFAAESHVDRSIRTPDIFLQTNVMGTAALLEAALVNKVPHFHHISTDEVFGSLDLNGDDKFTLQTNYDPRSPYSASKAASDHLVRAYGETFGLSYTITNCSNNYGPYQFPEKLFGLAITNLIDDLKVPIYGDGLNVRDWLFVEDHCRAIEQVILSGAKHKTYLVGGLLKDISNLDVIKMIIGLMGYNEDKIEFVTDRAGHDRRYSVDWSELNKDLGWTPTVTLEEGLEKTIAWYKHNQSWWRALKDKVEKYY